MLRLLLLLAVLGLWRQKVRSGLTLLGVTVGIAALTFSGSLSLGLQAFIEREFYGRPEFWRVVVYVEPGEGDIAAAPPEVVNLRGSITPERQRRLRAALAERYFTRHPRRGSHLLGAQRLAQLAELPGVDAVLTYRTVEGRLALPGQPQTAWGTLVCGPLEELQPRLLSGRLPRPHEPEIVVSELLLHDLGRGSDADLTAILETEVELAAGRLRQAPPTALARVLTGRLVGEELTVGQLAVLEKLARRLPHRLDAFDLTAEERAALQALLALPAAPQSVGALPPSVANGPADSTATVHGRFRICGVVRVLTPEEKKRRSPLENWDLARGELFLDSGVGTPWLEQLPWIRDGQLAAAMLRVRPGSDIIGLVQQIEEMELRTISAAKWFASAQREVALIATGLNLFALMALAVAAIGITNTLVTSVVERTREIGILRAVGATRGQVQGLFVVEGVLLGVVGGGVGLLLAWGLMFPADAWLRYKVAQLTIDEKLVSPSMFAAPTLLWLLTGLFAVAVTAAAALYPARRAAAIDPITALRYE